MESDLSLIGCALGLAAGKLCTGKGSSCAYCGNGDKYGDDNGDKYGDDNDDKYGETYAETKGEVVGEGGEVVREGGEVVRELRAVD
jgi:hypothetical protein